MKNKLTRVSIAAVVSLSAAFGLAACGSDAPDNKPSASQEEGPGSSENSGEESEAFVAAMTEGVKIVADQLAASPGATQIMLASDVTDPTQKYGMWVMPYAPDKAVVAKFISTIQVDGDKFFVTATSAETDKVWEMDQDGNMTEAAE
ncbi:hypothetical protein V5R04_01750 [Jonesiaceae bacterium BS-20]|uniref:Lipoprotein n=1 Tax=Jonesiaceae bacterium BS-20 TaxID=3120821 RepID=A0AAU7DXN7_9MICO